MSDQQQTTTPSASRIWSRILVGVGLVGLVLVGGWLFPDNVRTSHANAPTDVTASAQKQAMRLHPSELYDVVSRDLQRTVKFTGEIKPYRQTILSAQVSGVATTVNVMSGEAVRKGQILLKIDTTDLELTLEQQLSAKKSTEVQLNSARQAMERTKALADKGLTADSGLDSAVAAVNQLEASMSALNAQVEQVRTNIARAVIRAPFDGIVASRSIEPGQLVSAGVTLFSIVDLSRVTVDALVPLSGSPRIRIGQKAQFSVQGLTDQDFEAVVDRINPVAASGTRSVKVYLSLDNTDQVLRGGMFVTGDVVTARAAGVIAVPERAILDRNGKPSVLLVDKDTLVERAVDVAASWETLDLTEVSGGLQPGDRIVAMPMSGLEPGQSVLIQE